MSMHMTPDAQALFEEAFCSSAVPAGVVQEAEEWLVGLTTADLAAARQYNGGRRQVTGRYFELWHPSKRFWVEVFRSARGPLWHTVTVQQLGLHGVGVHWSRWPAWLAAWLPAWSPPALD